MLAPWVVVFVFKSRISNNYSRTIEYYLLRKFLVIVMSAVFILFFNNRRIVI
jgi:hypothetical protein